MKIYNIRCKHCANYVLIQVDSIKFKGCVKTSEPKEKMDTCEDFKNKPAITFKRDVKFIESAKKFNKLKLDCALGRE